MEAREKGFQICFDFIVEGVFGAVFLLGDDVVHELDHGDGFSEDKFIKKEFWARFPNNMVALFLGGRFSLTL